VRKLFRRICYLIHREPMDQDLADEMAAHREMMAEDRRRAFNSLRLREDSQAVWGWLWLERLWQDLNGGLMASAVSTRTREIGIRIANGAKRGDVLRMVLRQGLVLTLSGLAAGLVLSAGATRASVSEGIRRLPLICWSRPPCSLSACWPCIFPRAAPCAWIQ
jgi:FtsX-like permease family